MSQYSSKWIKVSEPHQRVLHIELARAPVNAFNKEFWTAYGRTFDSIVEDGYDCRAAVISSAFEKIFTAGLDLADAAAIGSNGTVPLDPARTALTTRRVLTAFQAAIGSVERAPFPVIAATHGHIIGLGVDMIAACDIRYSAAGARFAIKEVDIGLAPDIGSLAYLPKITGNHSLLRELTYTARAFDAAEALQLGLISKVVKAPANESGRKQVVQAALDLAKEIASKSPVAVTGSKVLIGHARDHSVAENLAYTGVWNAAALLTNDITDNLKATQKKEKAVFAPLAVHTPLSKL